METKLLTHEYARSKIGLTNSWAQEDLNNYITQQEKESKLLELYRKLRLAKKEAYESVNEDIRQRTLKLITYYDEEIEKLENIKEALK
jgi:hypothetical protein